MVTINKSKQLNSNKYIKKQIKKITMMNEHLRDYGVPMLSLLKL